MLCHTSGLSGSDVLGYKGENPGVAATLKKDKVHLLREPGTEFVYSEATGFGVCQLVIEEVTGKNFADYMKSNVFDKLDMKETSFADESEELAISYAGMNIPVQTTHYVMSGASSITTTGEDMAKFALELMRYQQSGAQMFVPQELAGGAWCLGISAIELSNGKVVFEHNGTLTGWNSQLVIEPSSKNGMIVLTNSDKAFYMTYQLMEDWGKFVLGSPIVDKNTTNMVYVVKIVLSIFNVLIILILVWNYKLMKQRKLVKKEKKICVLWRAVTGVVSITAIGCYIVLFYTPVIFKMFYQMSDYYLYTFFPPIINWLPFGIILLAGIVIWRSGYRKEKRQPRRV